MILKKIIFPFLYFFCVFLFPVFSADTELLSKTDDSYDTLILFERIEKKIAGIKTIYAELSTFGYDQDGETNPVFVKYWKSGDNIKKIMFDSSETVTTILNGDTFYVYYDNAEVLIKNKYSELSDTDRFQFDIQNNILDFYNIAKIKENFSFEKVKIDSNVLIIELKSKSNREDILAIINLSHKTLDIISLTYIMNSMTYSTDFHIRFEKFIVNPIISDNEFNLNFTNQDLFNENDFK